jgi:hypothetical protein
MDGSLTKDRIDAVTDYIRTVYISGKEAGVEV